MKNVNPGTTNLDLGDGYKASLKLPDIGALYEIEIYQVNTNDILKNMTYGFSISAESKELAKASIYVFQTTQSYPTPKSRQEDSIMPEIMGPRIVTAKTIDNSPGFVGYDLNKGETTDTNNAADGFFHYYPRTRRVSDVLGTSLEGKIEVTGESGGFPSSAQSRQVFNSIVDSIHISGPGI
jgi:hypothetical protein